MNGFFVCGIISLLIYLFQYNWTFILIYSLFFAGFLGLKRVIVPDSSQKFTNMRRKLSIASWSDPDSPECHGQGTILVSNAIAFLSTYKEKTVHTLSLCQLLVKIASDSYSQYNDMNGRLAFGSFIPNTETDVTLITPLDKGRNLSYIHLHSCNQKSLKEVVSLCNTASVPLYNNNGSVNIPSYLANLLLYLPIGISAPVLEIVSYLTVSMGIDLPGIKRHPFGSIIMIDGSDLLSDTLYPAIVPFLRAPIISILSSIKEIPVALNGKIVPQKVVTMTFTGDHRFGDGTRAIRAMNDMKKRLENPQDFYKIE